MKKIQCFIIFILQLRIMICLLFKNQKLQSKYKDLVKNISNEKRRNQKHTTTTKDS